MSNISLLIQDVQYYTSRLNVFNTAYIIFLTLTLVASTIIVLYNNKLNKSKNVLSTTEKQISEEKIAQLTVDAENARAQIVNAQAEVAKANQRTQELEQQNLMLAGEVATLQKDAAEARSKQADAERALLELQEKIKPRYLTTQQRAQFIEMLKTKPIGSIEAQCPVGDAEAYNFALQIAETLKAGGWQVEVNNRVMFMPPQVGLKLWIRNPQTAPEYASTLLDILNAIGLSIVPEQNPNLKEGLVALLVGAKP